MVYSASQKEGELCHTGGRRARRLVEKTGLARRGPGRDDVYAQKKIGHMMMMLVGVVGGLLGVASRVRQEGRQICAGRRPERGL